MSETPEQGRWQLDLAEVIGGVEADDDGRNLLWFRHLPTGLEARARTPRGSYSDENLERMKRELKPLLFDELEEKVAWRLRIPGRKWSQRVSN